MGIFLSLKQIADLLYRFKFLDIAMVLFAVALMAICFFKNKIYSGIGSKIDFTDYLIFILMVLFGLSFLRDTSALNEAVKIESAFLLYFLGRLYPDSLEQHGRKLAIIGYGLIFINAVYYFRQMANHISQEDYPFPTLSEIKNGGAFYYYKTDLAIAVLIGAVFIYFFSKTEIFKYFILYYFCPVFLFHTNARTGQVIYVALAVLSVIRNIVLYIKKKNPEKSKEAPKLTKKKVFTVLFCIVCLLLIILILVIRFSPVKDFTFDELGLKKKKRRKLENLFHSRHIIIWDTFHFLANQSVFRKLLGFDLSAISFSEHNGLGKMSHSLYLTTVYAVGFLGVIVFLALIYRLFITCIELNNERLKALTITMWVIFLFYGLSVETLEFTQISWFPFLMLGEAVSLCKKQKKERNI